MFQIAFIVYRHYLHRNVTSMNFDNPVYRKTTEDQFSLAKSHYQPQRVYTATVTEEVIIITANNEIFSLLILLRVFC